MKMDKWMEKDLRKKLSKAFLKLRKLGYVAKQKFYCCQGCALSALGSEVEKYVFYHQQDDDQLKEYGSFYLSWSGDAEEMVQVLKSCGLMSAWDGKDSDRVWVSYLG